SAGSGSYGAGRGATEVWTRRLEEADSALIAAEGDPRRAEVDPGGHGSAAREAEPEPANTVDVWKRIDEGEQAHHAAHGRTAEAQEPLLVAGSDRRQRDDEAGDHGRVDPGIVEADEEDVADQPSQSALHRKLHVLGIRRRVRQDLSRPGP